MTNSKWDLCNGSEASAYKAKRSKKETSASVRDGCAYMESRTWVYRGG